MLVGPDDPMFRDPLVDPRLPSSLPPGGRFDPIGEVSVLLVAHRQMHHLVV